MVRKSLAVVLALAVASPAVAAETTLKSSLSGAAGSGSATFKVDPAAGKVCYELEVKDIGAPVAAHIHKGAAGASGPPVVSLDSPASGKSSGCKDASADVANALIATPGDYYVNVHTQASPGGAVRGQLSK